MSEMTRQEFCDYIRQVKNYYDNIRNDFTLAKKGIERLFDGHFVPRFIIFDNLIIPILSRCSGISEEALGWFFIENEFGDKKLSCDDGKGLVIIDGPESFWDFDKR